MPRFIKKILRSWIIDTILLLVIVGGTYLAFNYQYYQQEILIPLLGSLDVNIEQMIMSANQSLTSVRDLLSLKVLFQIIGGIVAILFIIWRILWRIRDIERFNSTDCPKCGYPLSRIKRTSFQRLISKILPIRRFYCKKCRWKGLRIKPNDTIPLDVHSSSIQSITPDKIEYKSN